MSPSPALRHPWVPSPHLRRGNTPTEAVRPLRAGSGPTRLYDPGIGRRTQARAGAGGHLQPRTAGHGAAQLGSPAPGRRPNHQRRCNAPRQGAGDVTKHKSHQTAHPTGYVASKRLRVSPTALPQFWCREPVSTRCPARPAPSHLAAAFCPAFCPSGHLCTES